MSRNDTQEFARGWPQQSDFKRSVRLEFSLYVSIMVIILMIGTGYVFTDRYTATVTENVVDKLLVQSRSFSTAAGKHIIGREQPDDLMLTSICSKLVSENPDVYWVGIADKNEVFLAHTEIKEVVSGGRLTLRTTKDYASLLRDGELLAFAGDTITLALPIKENSIILGRLALGASSQQIAQARKLSITAVATITLIMLLIGVPTTMFVVNRKLRPITVITDRLQHIDLEKLTMDLPIKTRDEFGYLAETLRFMTGRVRESREQALENERVQRELEIAREIQANILPRHYPQSPQFEFAGAYESAKEVGGDYYDFVEHDERRLGFLIADVSGKSLPGMLVMLLTRDIVRNAARITPEPAELLSRVNAELLKNIRKGMFVTMSYAVLDTVSGTVTIASAGHNPLIWFNRDSSSPQLIKTKGYPLGLMPADQFDKRIEQRELVLKPGDLIVQYTDGVNEAINESGEPYGVQRFVDVLAARQKLDPARIVKDCLQTHREFVGDAAQFDDITLLVLKWPGANTVLSTNRPLEDCRVN